MILSASGLGNSGSPYAAYTPMVMQIVCTNDPIVYVDVYFNTIFFKTISSTAWRKYGANRMYYVDLQVACQEFLLSQPIECGYSGIFRQTVQMGDTSGGYAAHCTARVRGSNITNGVTIPEGPVPVQAREGVPAQPGGGFVNGNEFYVLNATLQIEDRWNLFQNIDSKGSFFRSPSNFRMYGLSYAKYYHVTMKDYGHISIWCDNNSNVMSWLTIIVETNVGNFTLIGVQPAIDFFERSLWYLPITPGSISMLPGANVIPWSNVSWYRICFGAGDLPANRRWKSMPVYITQKCDYTRIRFMNNLGAFESVNFGLTEEVLKVSSTMYKRPRPISAANQHRFYNSGSRSNVNSNEEYTCSDVFNEDQMPWIKELIASPVAYVEMIAQGNNGPLLFPIRIIDTDVVTRKTEGRYQYEVTLVFEMSQPNIHQRSRDVIPIGGGTLP